MTVVHGFLRDVTRSPVVGVSVSVRAAAVRTDPAGVVVASSRQVPVGVDGAVEFEVLPGPAVLGVVWPGNGGTETIGLVVPDSGRVGLRDVVDAAKLAGESEQSVLQRLATETVEALSTVREGAKNTQEAADMAGQYLQTVEALTAQVTDNANTASIANSHAQVAAGAAQMMNSHAALYASTARDSAEKASKSAETAAAEADRAEKVTQSVSWAGDKLTVMGKTSPSLTGPQGARGPQGVAGPQGARGPQGVAGPQGPSGASTWAQITGKPGTYPPETHSHSVSDITELETRLNNLEEPYSRATRLTGSPPDAHRLVKTDADGLIHTFMLSDDDSQVANKGYVDDSLKEAKSRIHALEAQVSALQSLINTKLTGQIVSSMPQNPSPNTVYIVR